MRKLIWMLTLVLLLMGCGALAESETVYLPDQSITVRVYGEAAVERTPNTVVYSMTSPDNHDMIWLASGGVISGDRTGKTTATLTEYDQDTDTYYVTKVKVTVLPRLSEIDYNWDQSANSEAFTQYKNLNGYLFPVGMEFSYRIVYTYDGEERPVTYRSSNPEVASIDENGWVTALSAGTTVLEVYCPELETGITTFITVYSANTGGSMWSFFQPEDPGATAKVYAEPSTASRALFTFDRYTKAADGSDLIISFLAKEEHWCKITCQLGTGWISNEYFDFSQGNTYESPSLEEGEKVEGMPTDEAYKTFADGSTVYGTSSESWIYKKPDRASDILVRLEYNAPVTVLEQDGSWLKVRYGSTVGYMRLHTVSTQPGEKTPAREIAFPCTMYVYCDTDLDMALFAQPGWNILRMLPCGTPVTALAYIQREHYDYIQVEVDGQTGYINERYLTAIDPNAPETEDPTPLTVQDAMRILQRAAGWSVSIDRERLDVNLDGSLTVKDALLILHTISDEAVQSD